MLNKEINYNSNLSYIRIPFITQKSIGLIKNNKYSFKVDPKADKTLIKKYIEYLFEVKVIKVNTCNPKKRKRRFGKYSGYKTIYKKAIVTLRKEDKINLISDL